MAMSESEWMEMAKIPDLFSQPPYQRHSETSKAAADSVKESAGTLREQVYDCIVQWGPICDEVISAMTGIPPNTVRPRRVELLRAGRIKAWGKTRTRSGRSAVAWGVIQ
jgi:hypothetical protein